MRQISLLLSFLSCCAAEPVLADDSPNNTIALACDSEDGSYLHVQNIHSTIRPQELFVKRDGTWTGAEPNWEGESYNVQTRYLAAWSIEVHYDDAGVAAQGTWKHSKNTRLRGHSVEQNLHPVDFLDGESGYCGGAANTLIAMCSVLQIPARYIGTWDHALVEYQDKDNKWRLVDNQPDVFVALAEQAASPGETAPARTRAQTYSAVFHGGLIDILSDPASFNLPELPNLGWYYNWSCPFVYDRRGTRKDADLYVRPQALHDWVFNLYTGYGGYEGEYIHKRGFFMAERFNSVYELAALYAPRRGDLPYVCGQRGDNDNVIYLTPFRDSYYKDWDNKTRIGSGRDEGVRKQFYLSDLDGVTKVVAAVILGPDGRVDYAIPADGGQWHYDVNGRQYPLSSHGGFKLEPNYNGTGMTVHRFEIPLGDLVVSK